MNETTVRETALVSAGESSKIRVHVLMLEDNPRDVKLCLQELRKSGFDVQSDVVDTEQAFAANLESKAYDLIISDYRIPSWSGAQAFRLVKKSGKDIPFILVTGTLGEEMAVDLIKDGVTDYILKDRLTRLPSAIRRALSEKAIRIEREQAIHALRMSESRAICLAESNIIGIAVGDLNGRLTEANGAFLKLVGYSRAELLAGEMRWDTMTPPEFRDVDERAIEQLSSKGVASAWEKQFIHKDGSRVSVLLGASMISRLGGVVECISFVLDIGERKKLEQQLRKAQKMEAIGQLAGGIAHDFNNHLSVIIGFSEVLLDRVGQDDRTRSHCEEIKKAGERAASLTRQLLAFSRQQVLAPIVLDLNHVVVETEKMLKRLIGEHIELRTKLEPSLGSVKADAGQIEQIILNLAVNARDAMPGGGRLVIETSNIELDEQCSFQNQQCVAGRYIMLAVSDTGTGMDDETQAHMFEPFFTTKDIGKGTGLGLSTVYGVVKQSGGYVEVESVVGSGTTFKIFLPRVDQFAQSSSRGESSRELYRGTETVLLVEDEDAVRKLTCTFLEEGGYSVIETNDGTKALELAGTHLLPIHILLTDVVMPGMNGRALAKKMVALRPETKVLYVTGYSGGLSPHSEILGDGDLVVPKPFSRKALLGKLREVLDA